MSLPTALAPAWSKGLTTLSTTSDFLATATALSIAVLSAPVVRSPSLAVVVTTIGLVPFAWLGKRSSRTSVALWLPVPGSVRLSLAREPTLNETTRSAMTTTAQAARTIQRRRMQNQPSR